MNIEDIVKEEIAFCESEGFEKNEHGQYIYASSNGNSSTNLPYILSLYKEYLIDNRIVELL